MTNVRTADDGTPAAMLMEDCDVVVLRPACGSQTRYVVLEGGVGIVIAPAARVFRPLPAALG